MFKHITKRILAAVLVALLLVVMSMSFVTPLRALLMASVGLTVVVVCCSACFQARGSPKVTGYSYITITADNILAAVFGTGLEQWPDSDALARYSSYNSLSFPADNVRSAKVAVSRSHNAFRQTQASLTAYNARDRGVMVIHSLNCDHSRPLEAGHRRMRNVLRQSAFAYRSHWTDKSDHPSVSVACAA